MNIEHNLTPKELSKLRKVLIKQTSKRYLKIFFAAEVADGTAGGLLWYSLAGENKIKPIVDCSKSLKVIEKIWQKKQSEQCSENWTGITVFLDGAEEEVKAFNYDFYKVDFFEDEEAWESKYFPGFEFELVSL